MKRTYVEDENGNKTQCWVGNKIVWTRDEESMTVFFYDQSSGESDTLIETSVLHPKTRKVVTTNRGPRDWQDWKTHRTVDDESFDDWEGGTWLKNAERDMFRIPSAFFTSGYDTKGWCEAIERAIVDIEAKHEEG